MVAKAGEAAHVQENNGANGVRAWAGDRLGASRASRAGTGIDGVKEREPGRTRVGAELGTGEML